MISQLSAHRVARLQTRPFTYPDPGVTRDRTPRGPLGWERTVDVGAGVEVWQRAADALMSWQVQSGAGLHVAASSPRVEPGAVVVQGLGPVWLRLNAPCRVVYVVDDERTRGFAYGTLPGHPESGEEAFTVTLTAADRVTFSVLAASAPANRVVGLAGPVARRTQHAIVTRYLAAMRRLAAAPVTSR